MLKTKTSISSTMYIPQARDWSDRILNVPKLRTYVTFKNLTEDYAMLNLKQTERSIIAQFRCGILPLQVETGRYVGEKPEEKLCKLPKDNSTENGTHFLLHCSHYIELRTILFTSITVKVKTYRKKERKRKYWAKTHISTFKWHRKLNTLMNIYPRQTAKYILNAFNILYSRN